MSVRRCEIDKHLRRNHLRIDNRQTPFYHRVKPVRCGHTRHVLIKQDLIQRIVERTGLVRTKAEDAVDTIFDSMKHSLVEGDRIELRGFGVFTVKPRKTGVGRNPRTGAEVNIAPGKAVRFKPGKDLQVVN